MQYNDKTKIGKQPQIFYIKYHISEYKAVNVIVLSTILNPLNNFSEYYSTIYVKLFLYLITLITICMFKTKKEIHHLYKQ